VPESVKLECDTENPSDALVLFFADGSCQEASSSFETDLKVEGTKLDELNDGECVTFQESPRVQVRITDFRLNVCGADMNPASRVEYALVLLGLLMVLNFSASF